MPGRDIVRDMLNQRASTNIVSDQTRLVSFSIEDLSSGTFRRVIEVGHPFRWLQLDPSCLCSARVYFKTPNANAEHVTIAPGGWMPIAGQEVWAIAIPYAFGAVTVSGTNLDTALNREPVTFVLTTEPSPVASPTNLPRTRAPEDSQLSYAAGAAEPSAVTDGVYIWPGFDYLTLQFSDNNGSLASGSQNPIVSPEVGRYEVWWRYLWQWGHNQNDDFDDEGRGPAGYFDFGSGTAELHNTEVYHIPHNARRIYVRRISGDTFYWRPQFSRGYRP